LDRRLRRACHLGMYVSSRFGRPRSASTPAGQPLIPATRPHVDCVHTALTPIMIPGNTSPIGGMRRGRRFKNLSRTRHACAAWCQRSNNNAASIDLRATRGILRQACARQRMAGRHRILDGCLAERERRRALNASRDCVQLKRLPAIFSAQIHHGFAEALDREHRMVSG
jgi:hypothetical protein